jgi:hypothetical protein
MQQQESVTKVVQLLTRVIYGLKVKFCHFWIKICSQSVFDMFTVLQ